MPEYFDIKEVLITIEFIDSINTRIVKNFKTVQELANFFLKDSPKVDEAVEYVQKIISLSWKF